MLTGRDGGGISPQRLAAMALLVLPLAVPAQSAIIYGSLGNFDIAHDTGKICHGFPAVFHPRMTLGAWLAGLQAGSTRAGDSR